MSLWDARRTLLSQLNKDTTTGLSENEIKKLDGSIKKNTAFIRKLKVLSHDSLESLLEELVHLKLEKYVQEIATAILEGNYLNARHLKYPTFNHLFIHSFNQH